MKSQRHLLLWATLAALTVPAAAFAIEIKGKVVTVRDGVATIETTSDDVPNVGDAVKFVEVIAGVGEASVAKGKVSEVADGKIRIKIGAGSGTVAVGHLVRIDSPNARPPQVSQPPATPSRDVRLSKEHNLRGNALFDNGKWSEAEAAYREAIRLDPTDGVFHGNLAGVLVKQGEYAEAARMGRKAVQLAPDVATFHDDLGNALYGLQKYDEAAEEYREAVKVKPKKAVYQADLAGALFKLDRFQEALDLARKAKSMGQDEHPVFSKLAKYHNGNGNTLYRAGKWSEAEVEYRIAIQLWPDRSMYHANLAGALVEQGRSEEALQSARKAKNLGLEKHSVFETLKLDSSGTNGADISELMTRRPTTSPTREPSANADDSASPSPSPNSGFGREVAGPGEVAPKFYVTDTDDPSYPMTRVADPYAALRNRRPSNRDKTLEYYRAEVRRDPHAGVTHYELGNALWTKGQQRDAEAAYREAVKREPHVGQFHHVLGFALGRRGEWKEAEACFRKALDLYKGWEDRDPIFRASLAEALCRQGKRTEARRYAQEALDFGERSHSIYKTLNMTLPRVENRRDDDGGETPN